MSKSSDLDRIAELTKRLEDLCREGEHIRGHIEEIASRTPYWPDRRRADGRPPSEFPPPRRRLSDQN